MTNYNLTVGCDPEVFATKNSRTVSAEGLVKGTKTNPQPVKHGAIQVDGMALEFNINPAKTAEEFDSNIRKVMSSLHKESGCGLAIKPVHTFTKAQMDKASKEAKKLGCEPDYNAYTGKENPTPDVGEDTLFRTAAGHIHLGWHTQDVDPSDPGHMESCQELAKALDSTIGVISVVMEGDNKRRELYGKAGAFRPKPYGMEYRVPSNWWIKSPKHRKAIFNICQMVFEGLLNGERPYEMEEEYVGIINGNTEVGKEFFPKYARYHLSKLTGKDQLNEVVPMLTEAFGDKEW